MALTPEQQSQADIQIAVQTAAESIRQSGMVEIQSKQIKLDSIRLAKEVLVENARSKPVDSRDVSAADIIAFAQALANYINE